MITFNKTIKNLSALRNALYKSTILLSPYREITSLSCSNTILSLDFNSELEPNQLILLTNFINSYNDVVMNEIVKVETTNKIIINEESKVGQTQGSFRTYGINFDAPLGPNNEPRDTEYPFTPGYNITALLARVTVKKEMNGDVIEGIILPQNSTAVGVCVNDVHDNDTVIYTTASVLNMIEVEKIARILIFNMTTNKITSKVRVESIDVINNTLTLIEPINIEDGDSMLAAEGLVIQLDNNIVGYTTTNTDTNQKWIACDSNSISYLLPGRFINLFKGNSDKTELREIKQQDVANNRILIERPFNKTMSEYSYIQMTLKIVSDGELHENWQCSFGEKTIGGSTITNTNIVVMHYRNNGPKLDADGNLVTTKRINCNLECLY